jgi:hypothetical protein
LKGDFFAGFSSLFFITHLLFPLQLPPIPHPRLFNHPAQYHIIQIVRRYVLGIQGHAFIFALLSFEQPERDTVDGGCCLLFEIDFVGGQQARLFIPLLLFSHFLCTYGYRLCIL